MPSASEGVDWPSTSRAYGQPGRVNDSIFVPRKAGGTEAWDRRRFGAVHGEDDLPRSARALRRLHPDGPDRWPSSYGCCAEGMSRVPYSAAGRFGMSALARLKP